jgi:hypothetical protein
MQRSDHGCDEPLAAGRRSLARSVGCQREPVNGENAVNTRPVVAVKAVVESRPSWCGVMLGSLINSWPVSRRTATVPPG